MDLYVVEPQTLFIAYLTDVLARADMDVVRIATAFDLGDIERTQPSAVFLDTDFLDGEPVAAVEMVHGALPAAPIFAYVGDTTRGFVEQLTAAGASCILSKNSSPTEVVQGIRDALASGRFIDPRLGDLDDCPPHDEVRYVDFRGAPRV